MRRIIDLICHLPDSATKITLAQGAKADMSIWLEFISRFNGKCLFLFNDWVTSDSIKLYSDASGKAYASVMGSAWFNGVFQEEMLNLHISVKDLYPILVAVKIFGQKMANHKVLFRCDNEAVVHVINSKTAKNPDLMHLLR